MHVAFLSTPSLVEKPPTRLMDNEEFMLTIIRYFVISIMRMRNIFVITICYFTVKPSSQP